MLNLRSSKFTLYDCLVSQNAKYSSLDTEVIYSLFYPKFTEQLLKIHNNII